MENIRKRDLQEFFNALTHGIGAFASLIGLIVLLVQCFIIGNALLVSCAAIYGFSQTLLYLCSTLYHSFTKPKLKKLFQILDHIAIYLLIAGTYTPVCLLIIKGVQGIILCTVVWTLALIGSIFKIFTTGKYDTLSSLLYLVMGWLAISSLSPLMQNMPPYSLSLLLIGGLSYSIGVPFYLWERLPYNHCVWHLFVMGGSTCHYLSIQSALIG